MKMAQVKSYGFMAGQQQSDNEYYDEVEVLKAEQYTKRSKHIKALASMVNVNNNDIEIISCPEFQQIENLEQNKYPLKSIAKEIINNEEYDNKIDFNKYYDIASWCVSMVGESPTAIALLKNAIKQGWQISFEDTINGSYVIDIEENVIYLDLQGLSPKSLTKSSYFRNMVLVSFLKSLRDIWHENKMSSLENYFSPENLLKLERYRNADIDTISIYMCWELRSAGYSEIWRHVLGSDLGDMAMIFTKYLERKPVSLYDGKALAYTFKNWFSCDNRVNECDHNALEIIDDILYASTEKNPFGSERLELEYIENLLLLPDGSKYIHNLGREIISSPYYAGMNDSVNQTHLLHIIYDLEVTIVCGVPFQDASLAKKIFPSL